PFHGWPSNAITSSPASTAARPFSRTALGAVFTATVSRAATCPGVDPRTRRLTRLFHPRRRKWSQHFRWNGPVLVGRTAIGRTTIAVLRINLPARVDHRASLIAEGVFPPE